MTVSEAILTLNANVVFACERAGYSPATVKMVEDALDTIEDALKAQEPIAPIQGADDQDEYIFCCGSCGAVVGETFLGPSGGGEVREKYCPECGRAVKWDG